MDETIEKTVPKFKTQHYLKKFNTPLILKLQQHKRTLIHALHKLYRFNYKKDDPRILRLKAFISNINSLIKQNFKLSISKHWETKLKGISVLTCSQV